MRSAVVISGHHQMFAPRSQEFVRYLKRECGIRYVADVHGWDRTPDDLASVISLHALRAAHQPFLLVYIGHGHDDGWYYAKRHRREWLSLKHSRLAAILKDREGPTLIVSDTCHASSLASRIVWGLGGPKPVGLIAATSPKGVAYGALSPDLLEAWRHQKSYVPQRRVWRGRAFLEQRQGADLDSHFFPRP
jgi:hypothetical protein